MERISERIIRLRKAKGLTQTELAKIIGISQPTVIKMEKGETDSIPVSVGKKMADVFEISFNDLFDIEDKEIQLLKEKIKNHLEFQESLSKAKETLTENEKLMIKTSEYNSVLIRALKYFDVIDLTLFLNKYPEYRDKVIEKKTLKNEDIIKFVSDHQEDAIDEIQRCIDLEKYKASNIDVAWGRSGIIRFIETEQAKNKPREE